EDAMRLLESYAWPGNVRELQNAIERACALAESESITRRDLPEYLLSASAAPSAAPSETDEALGSNPDLSLKDAKERWLQVLEASYLRDLLEAHEGNIAAAAKAAGIDRKTFARLINKYRLR